ncbi:hypothetical protein FHG66_19770 [Rubellimicrobium rubrum]|uniref:Uncharacterized protein n=1 Tax=Rubellimicrobium rubrum TaxID=2585369 RepID=A0A5C4MK96_9RHOB|nr:hypothetical protein [Rubellimicrobium rubrum]TNC46028.1 hypothetical protein FHG66_19770 [Rubellimicrobium rubrum]
MGGYWLATGEVISDEQIEIAAFGTGQRRTALMGAGPVRDGESPIMGGVAAQVDVTVAKAVERALCDSEERLRSPDANLKRSGRSRLGIWPPTRTGSDIVCPQVSRVPGV